MGLCALIQYALICTQPLIGRIRWNDGAEREVRATVRPIRDVEGGPMTGLHCLVETVS